MNKIKTAEARANLTEVLNKVEYGKEKIVLCRRDKELAALVSIKDYRLILALEEAGKHCDLKVVLSNPDDGQKEELSVSEIIEKFGNNQ